MVEARLPKGAIHQFVPLDSPLFVRRFLAHWRPDLALLTESEIWPNLIVEANDAGIPLVLVNARMSPRSHRRWQRLRSLSRPLFSRFDLVLTQNGKMAKRLSDLGAPKALVSGNLKYDAPPPPVDRGELASLRSAIGERPIFLAASTHPGEDEVIARVHSLLKGGFPSLLTIIAPRHPERGEAIARLMEAEGAKAARRSRGEGFEATPDIYVADTIGELGLFYSLAPWAFIGGSLVRHGGQNPLEAVKLGAGVLSGPHTFNFADTYHLLARYDACRIVATGDELAATVGRLLNDPEQSARIKERAQAAIGRLSGALQKTLDALDPYLLRAFPEKEEASPARRLSPADADHAA
jgi:3-deoxy-D-manno-octulosonic-acid transferase